ncbi:hypothetical protein ColLi_11330 [Colletotrichum liriopes]|uniref:Uncharacterized protein n=1 Tax=Colletotrichum liriopes TaxID=708192 RepID=A0AA37GWU5_9PEZI|nr:hypothetical protein ColLi_11330 [Colletotrichum liriopes]
MRDEWDCGDLNGKIDAAATAGVKMATSFGFALIPTLNSKKGLDLIGPHLDLRGRVKADITVEGRIEARVSVTDWEIQQAYPQQTEKYDPKELVAAKRAIDKRGLGDDLFRADLKAKGDVEVHLVPTMVFGIESDDVWGVATTDFELVCDGRVRMRADSNTDCGIGYAVDAGVSIAVTAKVPELSHWYPKEHKF